MTRKVLLVEDEFDTRELLGRTLMRAGYQCLLAESLSEAREHVAQNPDLELVITDIVLGEDEHGGLALLMDLGKRGLKIPVIVTTAYADVDKLKIALNEGAAHFLEKPFRGGALLEAIDRVFLTQREHEKPHADHVERLFVSKKLTDKERVVAHHLLEGRNSSEIGALESNSPKTIRQHVSQIYAKCGVNSRAEFLRLVLLR